MASVLLDIMLIMQIDGNSIIPYHQTMQTIRHKHLTVILLFLALAILSLVSNIYFPQEMEGQSVALLLQNSHCYSITVSAILLGCMAPRYLWRIHFGLLLLLCYVHHWGVLSAQHRIWRLSFLYCALGYYRR